MINVSSEIGRLRKVIIHSPGREIQDMTPEMAEKLLYNDIIPLSVVSEEHNRFKKVLQKICIVYEFTDLLKDALGNPDVKDDYVKSMGPCCGFNERGPGRRSGELLDMSAEELVRISVTGLKQKKDTISKFFDNKVYDINPLPNLYFTRDSAMVFNDRVITGAMANTVREPESLAAYTFFSAHPELQNNGFLYKGHAEKTSGKTIEGGDFLVLSENCIMIGISERTSSEAADEIIQRISAERPLTVFAVQLPLERATIHLDMIFTQLDHDQVMVYEPYICGSRRLRSVKIKVEPGKSAVIEENEDLLKALKSEGFDFKPVFCGNADPVQQQREQWLSGNNFFAAAPGKIIGYSCNNYTLDALNAAGYEILTDEDFLQKNNSDAINGFLNPDNKLVIGITGVELARGGGGARCMTMPVERDLI